MFQTEEGGFANEVPTYSPRAGTRWHGEGMLPTWLNPWVWHLEILAWFWLAHTLAQNRGLFVFGVGTAPMAKPLVLHAALACSPRVRQGVSLPLT